MAFAGLCFGQKPNLLRPTFSSGSIDNNRLTATLGEPFSAYAKGSGGSLSIGAQPGGDIISSVVTEPLEGVSIFPNPTSTLLNVNIDNTKSNQYLITIYDIEGKVVLTQNAVLGNNSINFNVLTNGGYIVNIATLDRKKAQSFTIIKN
jgi:Secretion system C-terminal sorting domain